MTTRCLAGGPWILDKGSRAIIQKSTTIENADLCINDSRPGHGQRNTPSHCARSSSATAARRDHNVRQHLQHQERGLRGRADDSEDRV